MKSCSYGTTCRTPATTTYSRGPGGEPRRPAASLSALVSRDIAETATNTPVGESVPQGAESATEEKGGGCSSSRGGRSHDGLAGSASHVLALSGRCPTDRPRQRRENSLHRSIYHIKPPNPDRSPSLRPARRLYGSLLITKERLTPRARQPTRARLSRPPALLSHSLSSFFAASSPRGALRREPVAKPSLRALHARAPAHHHPPVMRARVRISSAPGVIHASSLKSSRGGSG